MQQIGVDVLEQTATGAAGSPCRIAAVRLIFNLYTSFMSMRRTNELESNPNAMTGSDKLALSLPLLGLIMVPG